MARNEIGRMPELALLHVRARRANALIMLVATGGLDPPTSEL
jgi:hypothetical protein